MKFAIVMSALAALLLVLLALIPDQSNGATLAKKQYTPPALPWIQQVAAFYSGNNPRTTVGLDARAPGYMGATAGVAGSGDVALGEGIWESLRAFDKNLAAAKKGDKDAISRASTLGANGLAVLLHELTHSRPTGSEKAGGFKGWSDEKQAAALGAELVPDLLQRFFGIPIGSKLSRAFEQAAKKRSEYVGVYPNDEYGF